MQPMIMLTSAVEGIVSVNGDFWGEARPDAPLFRPVGPYGAIYLEFQPLAPGYLSMARRFAFSAGRPVPASFDGLRGVSAVAWPFGVTELELAPDRVYPAVPEETLLTGAGRALRVRARGEKTVLSIEDAGRPLTVELPDGAKEPTLAEGDGLLYVSGAREGGGRFVIALDAETGGERLRALGDEIVFLGGGRIAVAENVGDLAGHMRRTVWRSAGERFEPETPELVANPSGEFRATTPADCARAALECVQLGLDEAAASYFDDGARMDEYARQVALSTGGTAQLRFAPPDGRHAVAAVRPLRSALAEAVPVYYEAVMRDGAWKLTEMKADKVEP